MISKLLAKARQLALAAKPKAQQLTAEFTPSSARLHGLLAGGVLATMLAIAGHAYLPGGGMWAMAGLLTMPGVLLLNLLRVHRLSKLEYTLYAVAVSIVFLMSAGLLGNQLLSGLGQTQPLAGGTIGPWLSGIMIGLLLASAIRNRRNVYQTRLVTPSGPQLVTGGLLAIIPATAAVGAASINNGGTSAITMASFAAIAITITALVAFQKRVAGWVWPWAIFAMALAILWSISLRGSYITGHDIQLEYYVFRLTDEPKLWSMSHLRDAYNACLSITIMPTIMKSLTGIDAIEQYKIMYQIVFALFSAGVFALARRFAGNVVAFLAAIVFITFPTFLLDMPMLVRQEIAFACFIVLLHTAFTTRLRRNQRIILGAIFGMGMVLSHYSTTFVTTGILLATYLLLRPYYWGWIGKRQRQSLRRQAVSLSAVAVILLGTFVWTGMYTKTGSNIAGQITRVIQNLPTLLHPKGGSETSSYSIVKGDSQSDQALIKRYSDEAGQLAEAGAKAPNLPVAAAKDYPIQAVEQAKQPLTGFGRFLDALGIPAPAINALAKTGYALALQALILAGLAIVILKRRQLRLNPDILVLGPVGVGLIAFQAVMPTIEYGLFRMLQQNLVFLSLPIVLGALQLLAWLRVRSERVRTSLVAAAFSLSFLVLSGFTTQAVGGSVGQLALSNSGFYYDAYHTSRANTALFDWLETNYVRGYPIQSDFFLRMKIMANTGITTQDSIAPSSVTTESYVILANQNVRDERVSLYYAGGRLLTYSYPTEFLNTHKDLIYSNPDTRVYR